MFHLHAHKVNFEGANTSGTYIRKQKNYYHNYFMGNNASQWAGNVGLFSKVLQRVMYSGIDLALIGYRYTFPAL